MNHYTEADASLARLEIALRHGQGRLALRLLDELRDGIAARDTLSTTVECALIELDGSIERADLERFIARIEAAFDHDAHL